MKNYPNLFQKIVHSPKYLVLISLVILSIALIFYNASTSPVITGQLTTPQIPKGFETPMPTPYIGPITQNEPFPTPSLTINWTNKDVNIPGSLKVYSVSLPLINPKNADTIAQKFGLASKDEQEAVDINFRSWSKGGLSLSTNFTDNELNFGSGTIPQASSQNYSEDSYYLAASNYLQNVFGETFSNSLIRQKTVAFSSQGSVVPISQSKEISLVRVTYYQNLNNYPLVNSSQTGAIATLYLDANLGLNRLTVKDAFIKVTSLGEIKTLPLSEQIANSNSSALRIDSSDFPQISTDAITKNITFNQATAQVAYLAYKKQLIPVYLLEGTVKTSITPEQSGLYILPATSPQQ